MHVEERVLRAAAETGYRPNIVSQSLRTGTTHTIGFVSDTVATTRFAGDFIKGALEAARERGNLLFIAETEGDPDLERQSIETMIDRQVDGIVLASMYTRKIPVPKAFATTPAVLLNAAPRASRPSSPPSFRTRSRPGSNAARVLLDAGHRDGIYLIGGGPEEQAGAEGRARRRPSAIAGIKEAFADGGRDDRRSDRMQRLGTRGRVPGRCGGCSRRHPRRGPDLLQRPPRDRCVPGLAGGGAAASPTTSRSCRSTTTRSRRGSGRS